MIISLDMAVPVVTCLRVAQLTTEQILPIRSGSTMSSTYVCSQFCATAKICIQTIMVPLTILWFTLLFVFRRLTTSFLLCPHFFETLSNFRGPMTSKDDWALDFNDRALIQTSVSLSVQCRYYKIKQVLPLNAEIWSGFPMLFASLWLKSAGFPYWIAQHSHRGLASIFL